MSPTWYEHPDVLTWALLGLGAILVSFFGWYARGLVGRVTALERYREDDIAERFREAAELAEKNLKLATTFERLSATVEKIDINQKMVMQHLEKLTEGQLRLKTEHDLIKHICDKTRAGQNYGRRESDLPNKDDENQR